jgi:hypothetical protein
VGQSVADQSTSINGQAAIRRLLDQQADPVIRMLGERLLASDDRDDEVADATRPARRATHRVDPTQRLKAELTELRWRCRLLADALGACSVCWGEADGCVMCGGRGVPGSMEPDGRLFGEFVLPAVRWFRNVRRDASPDDRPGGPGRPRRSDQRSADGTSHNSIEDWRTR